MLCALLATPLLTIGGQGRPATASAAVEEFIRAAADSNLVRMSELFGTDKGSARKTGKPEDYQKRMVIMQAMMGRTEVRALSEVNTSKRGQVVVTTEIAKGSCKVVVPVTAVRSDDGWLVLSFDLPAIWDGINRPCQGSMGGN
jgi:hypothetical protein